MNFEEVERPYTMPKQAKILFFINGPVPSDDDQEAASKLAAQVVFRNANHVPEEGALEPCDGVAGAVPDVYAKAYPEADKAIAARAKADKAEQKASGDKPAPVAPVGKSGAPAWGSQNKS